MSSTELCLSRLFAANGHGLLADRDGDGLPDAVRARVIVDTQAGLPEHLAAVDVAARLGYETLALELPLVVTDLADLAGLSDEAIPLYIGRPTTLPLSCPARLRAELEALRPGEGLVAVNRTNGRAILIGGADAGGLADAARVVAAYLPALQPEDASGSGSGSGQTLSDVHERVRALCGDAETAPVVQGCVPSLVTRGGRVAEVCIGLRVTASELEPLHRTLVAGVETKVGTGAGAEKRMGTGARALPYDLTIVLDAGETSGARVVRIAGEPDAANAAAITAPPSAAARQVPPLRSLAGLFGPAGVAVDGDGDLLPEIPRTRILLPDDLSATEAVEAAHLGARLGLESLGLRLPLAGPHGGVPPEPGHVAITVEPLGASGAGALGAGEGEVLLQELADGASVIRVSGEGVYPDAQGRAMALRELARLDASGPPSDREPSLEEASQILQRLLALAGPDAWACAAIAAAQQVPDAVLQPSSEPLSLDIALPGVPVDLCAATREHISHMIEARAPGLSLIVDVDMDADQGDATVMDEAHRLPWEVDDLWARFTGEVVPALAALPPGNDNWMLDLRVSEPEGRRRQIKGEALRQIRATGRAAADNQVRVLPAYQQGRAWLLEEVAPRLQAQAQARGVATVTVRVRRFAPGYPCLELPIRWLQDLHLADEMLGERLGLPHHAIRFELVDLPHTYEVEARDEAGEIVLRDALDVVHGRRPYLAGFPEWGDVHPPTGCVRLLAGGRPVVDARLAPDPERVWDLVQTALLPRLRAHILTETGGVPSRENQPFFGELAVEVWLSEEDSALGLREERVSPLESLHEDIYFMLLDYCCAVVSAQAAEPYLPPWVRPPVAGEAARGPRLWMAPGRIVPYIHRADGGAARVRFTLTAASRRTPRLKWSRGGETGTGTIALTGAPECAVRITGLRWAATDPATGRPRRRVLLDLDGSGAACEQAGRLLAAWGALRAVGATDDVIPAHWAFSVGDTLHIDHVDYVGAAPAQPHMSQSNRPAAAPGIAATGHDAGGADGVGGTLPGEPAIPLDRVLGLSDIERIVDGLARSPRIWAYRAGRSAQGRASYAVEVTAPRASGIWSRAKLSTWKCTLLLNARHHANEPSSTNAVLRLADALAHDEGWRRYLDRVNVVIIPCENPDGAALHYALQEEHPTWMHHAGRYNDAGLEFTSEYANPLTKHTEALVLPALWRAWCPDIVCDNHGFPSHEWIQPFSGHSNPWFQSHWISQGLIYLIFPRIAGPRYPQHARAAGDVRRRMVRALAGDPAVRARNSSYADRYRTFLSDWLPEAFPAPFDEDVLVHDYDYDPDDSVQRGASLAGLPGAYPGVTTLSLITEVADETAQGRYMALCAHAHQLANRALLEYLYDVDAPSSVRHERRALPGGDVLLLSVRPRPAVVG